MAKYFAFSFLSLGAILILNSGDVTGRDQHPLILYRTSGNALLRPYYYSQRYEGELSSQIHLFNAGTGGTEYQLLYCGASNSNLSRIAREQVTAWNRGIRTDIVSKHCLFQRENSTVNLIRDIITGRDIISCNKEPVPLISRILSEDGDGRIYCGPGYKGVLYRYGYQIWLEEELFNQVKDNLGSSLTKSKVYPYNNIIDYEIYRICYDSEGKQVLYTQHRVISPKLLEQPYLTRGIQNLYPLINDNFDLEELNFHGRATRYSNYSANIGSSRPRQRPYLLNQMVPETDLSFSLWQKPLYHVVNNDLMNEQLFPLWNEITITCKNYAVQNEVELDIYTKTFNKDGEPTHAPKIWMKIIHLNHEAVAVIANNAMDKDLNTVIYDTYCNHTDHCRTFNFGTVRFNRGLHQYIMCCEINEAILELFNFNPSLHIGGLLWIDGLIDN